MKKFENIENIPATPQKERKIMTPKRRRKKESIPKEEERKEKCRERKIWDNVPKLRRFGIGRFNVKS